MLLETTGLPQKKLNILAQRGIFTTEQLLYTAPRKYFFFDKAYPLDIKTTQQARGEKTPIAIVGTVTYVDNVYKNGKSLIKLRIKDEITDSLLFVNIIGMYAMLRYYESLLNRRVIVGGILQYSEEYKSFSMLNPTLLSPDVEKNLRIIPKYRKFKGISEEYYEQTIHNLISTESELDYIPKDIVNHYHLLSRKEAITALHRPSDKKSTDQAKKRIIFDDMVYFTCKLEEQSKNNCSKSSYIIKNIDKMQQLIQSLSFTLTKGQNDTITSMCEKAHRGERVSALIQGDVGSGKTIVAFSFMVAMAENGYQSVLMAPTLVLAKQHYLELCERTSSMGFKTVLLSNEIKVAERRKVIASIEAGEVDFIIGTQSCISKKVVYKNLGLTVTDEEHKFGVLQREAIIEKSNNGVHNVIMSGTPIPRTLATTLYGNSTDVYSMELPSNRKPIQTAVCTQDKPVFEWMIREIKKGRQCYVVCPLIDTGEEGSVMEGISSVEDTAKKYQKYFTPLGIRIGVITGRTSKQEQGVIMQAFKDNKTQILLATTVIEVGVNNPNATVIVITGAERFGLATLHQLRGRVGRGEHQSYCILQKTSSDKDSVNLDVLCKHADGLEIAKADLANRGSGNLIGVEQSGTNQYIDLMLSYPNMYEEVKKIAKQLCETNTGKDIIRIYEEYYPREVL